MSVEPGMELVVPTTGEILSRDDPAGCARVYAEIKELETKLRALRGALADVLLEDSAKKGTKTLHYEGGFTAKVSTPDDVHWDHDVLEELLQAGLPPDRYEALVKAEVTFKIDRSVVRALSGANPVYAEILERAQTRFPKTPSVTVASGGKM